MLSRELSELPQAFAEFAESKERRLAMLETSAANLQDDLAKCIENTDQQLTALEAGQNRQVSDVETK